MTTKQRTQKRSAGQTNGTPNGGTLAEAIAYEQAIADEAAEIRKDAEELAPALFMQLRPLLRRQIPSGFIEHVDKVDGKPYESTGVKSVQVQMDRLDNVLGPHNWGYEATHSDDGKRCHVVAWVGSKAEPMFTRDSWGGMNRGSTEGNLWKGSFTNAAKLAFARLGPAWEVYVGAADFDPDTDRDAAKAQEPDEKQARDEKLAPERAEKLTAIVEAAGLSDHLPAKLRSFGAEALTDLTVEQGMKVWEWVQEAQKGGGS